MIENTQKMSASAPDFSLFPDLFSYIFFTLLSALTNATRNAPKEIVPKLVVRARYSAPRTGAFSELPFHHQSPTTLAAQNAAKL